MLRPSKASVCKLGVRRLLIVTAVICAAPNLATEARGVTRVAVMAHDGWCELLTANGYECVNLPGTGPVEPLDDFDVLIDGSRDWSDPDGVLADFMRAGKRVITLGSVPQVLGVDTDPTVQAWIGANAFTKDDRKIITVAKDPVLPGMPVGTILEDCAIFGCSALEDTTGHPEAKVLARLDGGGGAIAVMRNYWEGGQSIYFTQYIGPSSIPEHPHNAIILAAVGPLPRWIPAVSTWGMFVLTLLLLTAASLVLTRAHEAFHKRQPALRRIRFQGAVRRKKRGRPV